MIEAIQSIDMDILIFIQNNIRNGVLDRIMPLITALGDGGLIWIIISVVLLINRKYRKLGYLTVFTLLLSWIIPDFIIKPLVHRPRPFSNYTGIAMLISKPASYSFPSTHTAIAFAVGGLLAKHTKKYGFLFIILAFLIAFSRMYLFVHHPSDVLVGAAVGLACMGVATKYVSNLEIFGGKLKNKDTSLQE